MKLREFRLSADENIQPEVIDWLRTNGFDVKTSFEAGLLGRDDAEVLQAAMTDRRVILTHDRDFGGLAVAQREPFTGIVYLRPGHIQASFTIGSLAALLGENLEMKAPFIIVIQRDGEHVRIRVRNL